MRTIPAPAASSSRTNATRRLRLAAREGPGAGHPDAGRRGDLVAERLRGLEPGGVPGRAEDGDPGAREGIGDAGREGRLGADDDELGGHRPGGGDDRRGIERIDAGQRPDAWLGGHRRAPGRHDDLVDAGLRGELPGEGVLAAAAADDEDPGRHDEARGAHDRAIPPRWRIGRQARSIVWVRSGPTETRTIGTPASSSRARHVAAGVLGQVGQRTDVVDGRVPAREVLVDRGRAARSPRRSTASDRPAGRRRRRRRPAGWSGCPPGCRAC